MSNDLTTPSAAVHSTTDVAATAPLPANHADLPMVGTTLQWTSQSGGYTKVKEGVVVSRVAVGERPSETDYPDLYRGAGPGYRRNEVSYVVAVQTGKRAIKHYWPRTTALRVTV